MAAQRLAQKKSTRETCDNSDDSKWDRRQKHRKAGLDAVYRSHNFITLVSMTSTGERSLNDAPTAPDPHDRGLSKRQWELRMQVFKAAVKSSIQYDQ